MPPPRGRRSRQPSAPARGTRASGGENACETVARSLLVARQPREEGVVEPARADPLGLTCNALEAKVQARDDAQARRVVGRGGATHAMHAHALEGKV